MLFTDNMEKYRRATWWYGACTWSAG